MKISEKKKNLLYSLMIVFTAMLWGMGFVVQSDAMDNIEPITFNGIRNLIGCISVLPACFLLGRNKQATPVTEKKKERRILFLGGLCCGLCLFVASNLQQAGLVDTPPGKAGFITALYIVLVPILGLFTRKKIGIKAWLGVVIAVGGLYLLCVKEGFQIEKSDLKVILCALFYSLHIVVIDCFAAKTDCVKMSCIQFLVCGVCSMPLAFVLETPSWEAIRLAGWNILYAGVFSCGVAFTLQVVAQKHVDPTVTSLLMSLESCFAAVFSWLILHQTMSKRELLGVAFMIIAIVLVQLPQGTSSKKRTKNE